MSTDPVFQEQSWDAQPGRPLAPWTYTNPEFFELDYDAFFLRRWQFVGHANDVREAGDYLTHDIGRDNVVVIRGKDNQLRAFKNVCRHRASRLLQGSGNCPGTLRCPYHGWTYQLDGSLMAVPQEEQFPTLDKSQHGLHEIQLESFHGLLFVRVKGHGPSLAEHFGDMGRYLEMYDVANYEMCAETTTQVWNCNWKVAWDNYLENYHIPIGHPGLHRLLVDTHEGESLSSGVDYGIFDMRSKPSNVEVERRYQELVKHTRARIPEEIHDRWIQFGIAGSHGLDFYPEMLDIFQIIPLAFDKTLVRAIYYGHVNPTPEEQEIRKLNIEINNSVNDEDKTLCERVQHGLQTTGYEPGPLSKLEIGIHYFHTMVRDLLPVAALRESPPRGQVVARNSEL